MADNPQSLTDAADAHPKAIALWQDHQAMKYDAAGIPNSRVRDPNNVAKTANLRRPWGETFSCTEHLQQASREQLYDPKR